MSEAMKTIANTPPDISGHAKAWKQSLEGPRGPDDAAVSAWVVNAHWSHPFWPNVLVACVHLRNLPGQTQPPVIHLPGATHEISVQALHPDSVPEIGPGARLNKLIPANFVGQFIATSDDAAAQIVEAVVREVCNGQLNPDTDGVSQWIARFGDHCFKDHMKRGIVGHYNQEKT